MALIRRPQPAIDEVFQPRQLTGAALAIDALTAKVSAGLAKRGIRSIVFRGPAIRNLLYRDGAIRGYRDVDLLVAPWHLEPAIQTLRGMGYEAAFGGFAPHEQTRHSSVWIDPARGIPVDLHATILGVGANPEVLWAELAEGARPLKLAGGEVQIPSAAAQTAIIALHAAQHGRRTMQTLADLERALAQIEEPGWRSALGFAVRTDALGAFAAGLRLLQAGVQLADQLGLGHQVDLVTAIHTETPRPTALGFADLATADGWRERRHILIRKLRPTPAFMRHAYPVARRGPGGLLLAYLWRPIALLGQAGPGLRVFLRASRRAKTREPSASRARA